MAQETTSKEDIHSLKNKRSVSRNSKLLNLSPFIDTQDIIRVGGQLQKVTISPDSKPPILLPADHPRLVYEHQNIYKQERKLY